MKTTPARIAQASLLLALYASTPSLPGAGFQLSERSASGLGRAFSGEAAIADNATVLSSNPAALLLLGGDWHFASGVTYIEPGADVTYYPALRGGNDGPSFKADDIAESAWVPYLYATKRVTDDLALGLGLYTTYGLRTSYDSADANLMGTKDSEITSVNLNPSFSFRLSDRLLVGGGFNALYAEGELTAHAVTGTAFPSFGLEGDDWGFGYNLGLLYEFSPQTRVGLSYRSAIDLDLEGEVDGSIVGGATVPGDLALELPASIEFSLFHQLNEKWSLHGDVFWTQWSSFEALEPKVDTGNAAVDAAINAGLRTPQNWEDSFRYALGATYSHDSQWTFRAGIAFDESPVDDENRNLRIPDSDRFWLSIGASYAVNEHLTLDAGYSYIFIDSVSLGQNDKGLIDTRSKAEGDIQLFSLGLSGSF
ncbi:OmpP1/FadL family transporter [Roseibacillus ishigakijimensis]|uniref:Outer membrane protein transport protein n=1 Tax=Roseibacillus ishigakijimensis TaxID=454146 RepID=A0A934VLD4_9BACT|nr:outer membrane protein transport protein [Roseibacillus ishigakijimensis]MBK1832775.1 outer membrane protein transport protein [Roseibacillus ishigakijimensis]